MQSTLQPYTLTLTDELDLDDTTVIYSKHVIANLRAPYAVYASMDATAFVCLAFDDSGNVTTVHHCATTSKTCNTYPIDHSAGLTGLTKAAFEGIESFKVHVDNMKHALTFHSTSKKTSYTLADPEACSAKRLVQIRGFCYYHAVLHGILMSGTMQRVCCQALMAYMGTLPTNAPTFSLATFMDTGICENFESDPANKRTANLLKNAKYFIMKFFYQYLFHFENVNNPIVVSLADRERNGSTIRPHPVEILAWHEKEKSTHQGMLYNLKQAGFPEELCDYMLINVLGLTVYRAYTTNNETTINDADVIVYKTEYEDAPTGPLKISSKQPAQQANLEFGLITVKFRNNESKIASYPVSHAIVGVICNGKYFIIDSNGTEKYYPCDWRSAQNIKDLYVRVVYKKAFERDTKFELMNIITHAYYIKPDRPTVDDTCAKIKATYVDPRIYKALLDAPLAADVKAALAPAKAAPRLTLPPLERSGGKARPRRAPKSTSKRR
jgi:hypothetical protein